MSFRIRTFIPRLFAFALLWAIFALLPSDAWGKMHVQFRVQAPQTGVQPPAAAQSQAPAAAQSQAPAAAQSQAPAAAQSQPPAAAQSQAQTLSITFRYVPDQVFAERAFLPGSFNGWGAPYKANTSSCIREDHASAMSFVRFDRYWRYAIPLEIGETYEYKVQVHRDIAGADCVWLTDPLNPRSNPANNNNSALTVTDPMIFQPAQEADNGAFSAGLFSTQAFASIVYHINGVEYADGLDHYDADTGVFRVAPARRIPPGAQFRIEAADQAGRRVEAEIGRILAPVEWVGPSFSTVKAEASLRARVAGLDGAIDPNITQATLLRGEEAVGIVPVTDGEARAAPSLELGDNEFRLRLDLDGQALISDPITVTRRLHPLDIDPFDVSVTGSGHAIAISFTLSGDANIFFASAHLPAAPASPGDSVFVAVRTEFPAPPDPFDDAGVTWTSESSDHKTLVVHGAADGPGEAYFNLLFSRSDYPGETFRRRVAAIIEEDGVAREMRYEETASWVRNAVVYEIFPFSFGPAAFGALANPGGRLRDVTRELDYIADMGFNAIWFMPIMHNQVMDQISGGYNIIDFYRVDPRLGTNADFKALVQRAHELGIRIIMDITPSHVSPAHPWVASLRNGGPYGSYLQTEPSPHNLGRDNRGANLPEALQPGAGYYKYQGFGDLANLDWNNDDLQAEMLDALAFWVNEFDIDGWRLDVYWGPWRRYGPERFGRPLRTLMKRLKPDAWLLGEIVGTGAGTEVYYADALHGDRFEGGIDAGYDWPFYHNVVRGGYGRIAAYDRYARNNDFYPGPNARYFRFLENHDEPRIAALHASNLDRLFPLAGFLLTTTGVPMVYQGQEVAFRAGSDPRRAPVHWETPRNREFARHYQRLAHARARFPAFGSQALRTLTTRGAYGYVRPREDENAVVLVNFSSAARTLTVDPGPHVETSASGPIPYYDIFADTLRSYAGAFEVTVPPYGTVIYITSTDPGFEMPALPPLPYGAVYVAAGREELPGFVKLSRNYPNPFNPETIIEYTLPRTESVRLVVYDLLGREVARLVDGVQPAGRHRVRFQARELSSGTYVYRLETAGEQHMQTMILAK